MNSRHIPWFNPREMLDETVLALCTGRDALLAELLQAIQQRARHPGQFDHWLITGPRGAGKSYFLRLVQASLAKNPLLGVRFVLLPEELPNIFAPHELLLEIGRMLNPLQAGSGASPRWRVAESGPLWDEALGQLLAQMEQPLLVVGIENVDDLIRQAFSADVDNSRLRHLMSTESRIMFVATAVQGDFDEQHHQRLFRQFEHRTLRRWDANDHRSYLRLRAAQQQRVPRLAQLNRIDAYSRYTGGNARAAAILAATILDEDDILLGAGDLDAAIEKMSDYYRALIQRIPDNAKKLFDALVRGGEPASQTELAERTGARQSEISRAFAWLVDYGYVSETQQAGGKAKQYRVLDRLLVQFYRMRYLQPGQRSRLAVMAELLAEMLSFSDKWRYAGQYVADGNEAEAQTLVELALQEREIDIGLLPNEMQNVRRLLVELPLWKQHEAIVARGEAGKAAVANWVLAIFDKYQDDAEFAVALQHASALAGASACGGVSGQELVPLIQGSMGLNPVEHYRFFVFMSSADRDASKWRELKKLSINHQAVIRKLVPTEGEAIATLQRWRSLGTAFPLTVSLHDFATNSDARKNYGLERLALATVAHLAVRAAAAWQKIGEQTYLEAALAEAVRICEKSANEEYEPQALLAVLNRLEPLHDALKPDQKLHVMGLRGAILGEMGQAEASFLAHQTARNECLRIGQVVAQSAIWRATWSLERMAWYKGVIGDMPQAIKLHQEAIQEWLGQGKLNDIGWNLGQIARYRIAQTNVTTSWQELDSALALRQTDSISACQQLGDAVADASVYNGHAAAFAVGLEMLQGLAQRPQYPAEAVLRGLWIDMIEMEVPFAILQELLEEWPNYWHEPDFANIHAQQKVWLAFLAYLQAPPNSRSVMLKNADPDLATTLHGLAHALPARVQHRLGLLEE